MQAERAVQESRAGAARAVLCQRSLRRGNDLRRGGEAQVVVRGEMLQKTLIKDVKNQGIQRLAVPYALKPRAFLAYG